MPGFVVTARREPGRFDDLGLDEISAVEEGTRQRVELLALPELSEGERAHISAALAPYEDVTSAALGRPARLAERVDALVIPAAEYVALDSLAPDMRPSCAGHVATLVAPVAEGLTALHEAGLAHGGVGEGLVSIDTQGRPRLLGAGARAALHVVAPREVPQPTPAVDGDGLLAMLARLAEEVDDPGLSGVTDSLLAQGAGPREVSERLLDEIDPVPLGERDPAGAANVQAETTAGDATPSGAGSGERLTQTTWRPRWLVWAALATAGAVVAGTAAWLVQSGSDDATTAAARTDPALPAAPALPSAAASPSGSAQATTSAAPTPSATGEATPPVGTELCGSPAPVPDEAPELAEDWTQVVDDLYLRRSAALVTGQTSLLCDVYDPLSPGLPSDLELDAAYSEQGVRPDSLVFVVEAATLVEQEGALLVLEITDSLEPYVLRGEDGRVVAELPGISSETWQARLVPDATGTQWRFG